MKYPIGIQSFEKIRKGGFVYIDKTELVYKLSQDYDYVFLGRPRRFGKSLLMSTMQAYFEGRKELFEGLAIEKLETEWTRYPVLHFDLNNGNYSTVEGLMNILNDQLSDYEEIYGRNPNTDEPQFRLRWIITQAHKTTGQPVVILIDEYDKPVLQSIGNPELDTAIRNIMKPFYGTLKSEDEHIRFAMLTGVSKFGKLSVFSDLNNIKDISMLADYAEICGITEHEILSNFREPLREFADSLGVSEAEMIEVLRRKYDGYRFSRIDSKVFNPYSLLNAFSDRHLGDYWFESGTPTFLVRLLQQKGYSLSEIDGVELRADSLYRVDDVSAVPILYQSGYLTIKDYNLQRNRCRLGYPNQEVEAGFLDFLLPYYSGVDSEKADDEISGLVDDVESGDAESFMSRLRSILYSIPYSQDNTAKVQEDQFRNLTYLIFKLMGLQIQVECPMSKGRSDAVICTADYIYVIELKVDSTPEQALAQIHERGYAEPFRSDSRRLVLIGANYSTAERTLTSWQIEY